MLSLKWRRPQPPAKFVLGGYTAPPIRGWRRELKIALVANLAFLYGIALALYAYSMLMPLLAPLALFALFIIWMLPDTENPPMRAVSVFFWSFLVAQMIWPDYLALDVAGLPWITALRLFGFPLALLFLISLSVSPSMRNQLKTTLQAPPKVWKWLTTFMVLAAISVAYSSNVEVSLNKLVVALLYWMLIFFVSVYQFSRPGRVTAFAWLMWGVIIFLAVLAYWEHRLGQVPWAGHIPSFLAVQDESVQRILVGAARAATGIYRVQSKFTTSLGFAEFLGITTPFVLHFLVTSRKLVVRFAALITLPVMFHCIIMTDSRLGVVGFMLSFLFYLFFWGYLRRARRKDSLIGTAVIVAYPAVLVAFLASTMFVPQISVMVWGGGAQQASTNARQDQYRSGTPMVIARPWGYGLGRGAAQLGFVNRAGIGTIDTYVLAVALEVGIPGLIAYFGMFIVTIYAGAMAVKGAREHETMLLIPVTIALANFVVIKTILSQLDNHPLVFAMLGAAVALIDRARKEDAAAAAPGLRA
ncbi:O-antigen ligase family protein [Sphingobium limneticum]|uniref:O-antigen ligase family protein n=1 Tax=Sphingobium limneticum TaxID=1007511 RepID=UPI00123D4637|nr:O-antigen ligase family protein [Sphingobium limneticum]KAA9013020.1 O-antigen ligase family protein [Sphingobium limneticum]